MTKTQLTLPTYKALMLDVDGTIVPYDYDAVPSEKVKKAVRAAQDKITVCIATGRSYRSIENILKHFQMKDGFAIINNGAQVIDISNDKILYEKKLSSDDVEKITTILAKNNAPYYIDSHYGNSYPIPDAPPSKTEALKLFTEEIFDLETVEKIVKELSDLSSHVIQKTHHKHKGKFGLLISHAQATKLHGVVEVAKILGINTHEIIGVGDGYNDFPLLMACGLRVAMGNAVEELKEIADYVAPSVDDDGVADVIEKYVLSI